MTEQGAGTRSGVPSVSDTDLHLLTVFESPVFTDMIQNLAQGWGLTYGALVLVGDDDVWFGAPFGFTESTTPREGRLWDAAMAAEGVFVVEDLGADARFAGDSPSFGGVDLGAFVSSVFFSPDGRPIGVICLADAGPREFVAAIQDMVMSSVSYIQLEIAAASELDRASEVQRALLPKRVPPLEGYEVAGACLPARFVGGDFFDWYSIEGGIAFTLSDVMGKGVGAGIIAATVRATLRTARNEEDVAVAVERAAEALADDLNEAESFATLFHARLRAADGHISFVDAGHGLTVVVDADGTAHRLSTSDLPLGLSFLSARLAQEVVLEKGGMLVAFSDGVLDLYDGSLESVDRVADIVRAASSAQEVVDELQGLAMRGDAPDDVTVVAIRRLNEGVVDGNV